MTLESRSRYWRSFKEVVTDTAGTFEVVASIVVIRLSSVERVRSSFHINE